jgi:hypothetical protein
MRVCNHWTAHKAAELVIVGVETEKLFVLKYWLQRVAFDDEEIPLDFVVSV